MRRICLCVIALVTSVNLLSACGAADSPEKAATEAMQALVSMDGLKLDERTAQAEKEQQQKRGLLITVLMVLGSAVPGVDSEDLKLSMTDLKVSTLETQDDTAQVRVTAKVRVAVKLVVKSVEIDQTWRMVREDGEWRYCGPK